MTADVGSDFLRKAQASPVGWMRRFLGEDLWQMQQEIAEAVRDHPKVAVRSCHASGKTRLASSIALWFAYSFPNSRVITTAPGFRQVKENLWGELAKTYYAAKTPLGGKLLPDACQLKLGPAWGILGFATDQMERFHGFHAPSVFVVVDEASGVEEGIFEAIEGARSAGATVRLLLLSQMTRTSGTFYNAFNRDREYWQCFTIAADETPNFAPAVLAEWEAAGSPREGFRWPRPYLINPAWAREMADTWGEDSDLYRVRVLGMEPRGEAGSVIPLFMVEAALIRQLPPTSDATWLGVDVARYGDDDSVLYVRRGGNVLHTDDRHGNDTMQVAEWAHEVGRRFGATDLNVDEIGVGAGVVDRLKQIVAPGVRVHGINAGASPRDQEHFANRRAEDYMGLRQRFEAGEVSLAALSREQQERLIPELTGLRWKPVSPAGKMQLEAKDDYRKRLGRSPDAADGLMLAFAVPDDRVLVFASGGGGDPFFGDTDDLTDDW